ncbi:hypothetical protein [Aestuariivirga sp.]|uniref:hypothetical protein n=1 Tax=Aestuariivirga sp. TaxID=2650926 RepID=UPI0039E39F04
MKLAPQTPEDRLQYALLQTPPQTEQGGRVRYAAAMYFYNRAMLDAETLEAFRVVAKEDKCWPDVLPGLLGLKP